MAFYYKIKGVGNQGTGGSDTGSVSTKSNSVDSIAGKPPLPPGTSSSPAGASCTASTNGSCLVQPKTASIRQRPTSSRITASEIEGIFAEKTSNGAPEGHNKATAVNCPPSPVSSAGHKIYASVAEMKRSKVC